MNNGRLNQRRKLCSEWRGRNTARLFRFVFLKNGRLLDRVFQVKIGIGAPKSDELRRRAADFSHFGHEAVAALRDGFDELSYRALALKELAQAVIAEVETIGQIREVDLSRGIDMQAKVRNYEIALIQRALKLSGGSQRKAARMLGLLPTTLNNKIKRHQIEL